MGRDSEKKKTGNAFIMALKKSNMTAMAMILVVMIIIASIVSPYFLNIYNLQSVLRDLCICRDDWYRTVPATVSRRAGLVRW